MYADNKDACLKMKKKIAKEGWQIQANQA